MSAQVDSISDLFARDPLEWSEADMVRMIEHYRKERVKLDSLPTKEKTQKAAKIPAEDMKNVASGADLLGKLGIPL